MINGDCAVVLADFKDQVDLIVTSPPYGAVREYAGYAEAFDFDAIADAIAAALKPGGTVCWVVWDQVIDGFFSLESFRQALGFDARGIKMHQPLIHEKDGVPRPGSSNRFHFTFEWVWVMSKGAPRTFNPIIDKRNRWAGRTWKHLHRNADGSQSLDAQSTTGNVSKRGSVWRYSQGYQNDPNMFKRAREHPAIYPYKLASDLIKAYSNEGDLVVDPMCGSGTTLQAAQFLKRRAVGIDVNPDYCELSRARLAQEVLV